ncbi:MAG: dolichyl-phosphate beta-glucosyltransferase [Phycisphaerales bacterium]|jgi:dolichyl-phosphate beta-glucosyltransferase
MRPDSGITIEPLFTPTESAGSARGPLALSVIIPMFRERDRVELALRDVLASLPGRGVTPSEVLLVDDGSDDDTAGVCRAVVEELRAGLDPSIHRITLVTTLQNRGKGAAVRTGLAHASGRWRLIMDADNATAIDQLDRLLSHTQTAGTEMVIGSRNTPDAVVEAQAFRQLTGIVFKTALSVLGIRLARDTQCGFKLYSDRAAALVVEHGEANGYCFDIEHLLLVRAAGARFTEVGVRWHHVEGGQISPIRDGLRMLRAAHRIKHRLSTLGPIELPAEGTEARPGVFVETKPAETKPLAASPGVGH